ncbi:MAG: hypothetical protein AAFU77_07420 [Myxococcota bacterium]
MRTFSGEQLLEQLRIIDRALEQSEDVILIGGAAIAVAYGALYATNGRT